MHLISGLTILLLFQCLGEAIRAYFFWVIPGPVIGMALLFLALCLHGVSPSNVTNASERLIPLLGLMFLPAAVGIYFLDPTIIAQWPAIISAIVLGSILSLIVNALVMKWLCRHHKS